MIPQYGTYRAQKEMTGGASRPRSGDDKTELASSDRLGFTALLAKDTTVILRGLECALSGKARSDVSPLHEKVSGTLCE